MRLWNQTLGVCVALAPAVSCAGCGSGSSTSASVATTSTAPTVSTSSTPTREPTLGRIAITSPAFKIGGQIASRYTCDGADLSPPLEWHGVPAHTAELVLFVFDVTSEGANSVSWAVAGISPSVNRISAGKLPAGAVEGVNSAGKRAWGGICGPKGQLQHVAIVLYALRRKLALTPGFSPPGTRSLVTRAKLASGLTVATYQRP